MKKNKLYIILLIVVPIFIGITAFQTNVLFKINRSFELLGAVYKQILDNYVLDIDPEKLMESGINGMLADLDPYTVYYSNEDLDDIDIITLGRYIGFGISVRSIDDMITITDVRKGLSADNKGVKIGDIIYSIDDAIVVDLSSDDLRFYTRGNIGSISKLRILRNLQKDTIEVNLTREQIQLENVTYSGLIDNNIGYIKLERFNRQAANEVRNSFYNLKEQSKELKGIILDLRDNPGGLLDAAIGVCEIFVPRGSLIVSTKGKDPNMSMTFHSMSMPIDTLIPLAVLINERSASASEIVAGAIQDLDRGVILGNRSFGKGLVQSVFELPYNHTLKMTTSKYYTPSGRCIQKLNYAENNNGGIIKENSDTNIFYTNNKRIVKESTGILPDSIIIYPSYTEFTRTILEQNHIFKFVHYNFNQNFNELKTENLFTDFRKYLDEKEYQYEPVELYFLNDFYSSEEFEQYPLEIKKEFSNLIQKMEKYSNNLIYKGEEQIRTLLELELIRKTGDNNLYYQKMIEYDSVVNSAKGLIRNDIYSRILANQPSKEMNSGNN